MTTMRNYMVFALLLGACTPEGSSLPPPEGPAVPPTAPPPTSGNEESTFDHMNDYNVDPWALLEQMQEEGPPEFSSRLHSCPKVRYGTLGRILSSRGIDLGNAAETSAGFIYSNSDQALGVANYPARIAEASDLTTASAAKLFDIWVAAAPEIIASMPSRPECTIGGVGTSFFNEAGQCNADGISCLIGQPATLNHVQLCNLILGQASTPELGRVIAVAALASAAHTCE
jgi:hypothetical protein